MKFRYRTTHSSLLKIPLVDRCLLLIFMVLILQSAYSLYVQNGFDRNMEHIDIIVRTSAASIFGYLLSANFIRPVSKGSEPPDQEAKLSSQSFEVPDNRENLDITRKLQIIIATAIGMLCLIILIIFRNTWNTELPEPAAVTATIAQLRDFVSSCVGFLIGSPSGRMN